MGIDETLKAKREQILAIARRHGAHSVRVFGSLARGDARPDSDVDLLIEVSGPTPAWFPGGLVAELGELLDRRVDVIESEALDEEFRSRVLKEAVTL